MTDRPIAIGVVGAGSAASSLHLPALAQVTGIKVVGIADPNLDQARLVAGRFGIGSVFGSLDAMLRTQPLDALALITPPGTHADLAVEGLAAGKHLFVEKPLALTAADCDRIAQAAAAAKRVVMVGFNSRFHRLIRAAGAAVQAGSIGRVVGIRSTFSSPAPGPGPWRRDPAAGGGVESELGSHHFDLWRHLTGAEPVELVAIREGASMATESVAVMARFSGGVVATGQFAHGAAATNEVVILGSSGTIAASLYDYDGLRVCRTPGGIRDGLVRLIGSLAGLPAALGRIRRGGDVAISYRDQWAGFLAATSGSIGTGATVLDGSVAAAMARAVADSTSSGGPVTLR